MKKWILSILTMILCMVTPVAAFAQNTETEEFSEEGFHLTLDATDTSEQVYEINGIEFRVLPTLTQAQIPASKTVIMTDLYNNANLGTMFITATCISDGKIVGATSYSSKIINKPTSSDLKVTGTTVTNNNTVMLRVNSSVSYTSSTGTASGGTITMYVYANGVYN
ncbi:hypothetical protein [Lysinibacillus piscis]|uniref:Uncharacterized protein n=1 Tax=Lysinibacillus piscis TaxID=2518931 RepID=A0ABQ5NHC0_9BACI|nr:hypothetical protein [Lysinibacillus sp. KH24]GLC87680.1 hypothetical protein LYSBPC_08070 [Lysinibacillus sp. KH24]